MAPRRIAVLSLVLSVLILLPASAAPVPDGDSRQLNESSPYWQVAPAATATADGGFFAVWEDMRRGVVGRFVSSGGELVGSELVLAANTPFPERSGRYPYTRQASPAVAGLSDGGFLAVWVQEDALLKYSYFWHDLDVESRSVMAQRFNAAGAPAGDAWRIDAPAGGLPGQPSAALLADGRVAVTWQRVSGDATEVAARVLDPADGGLSAETVAGAGAGAAAKPSVAATAAGFLVAWTGSDSDGRGVWARTFAASGHAAGPAVRVNAVQAHDQGSVSLAPAAAGGFLVAWQHADTGQGEYLVKGRFLNAGGQPVGDEQRLTVPVASRESSAVLTARSGGGFHLFWMGWEGNSPVSVAGLELDGAGQAVGEPVLVSAERPQPQWHLAAAAAGDHLLVAWEGLDERSRAIRGRLLAAPAAPEGDQEEATKVHVTFCGTK
jgi:hypothetical protein